jgi:hypothetical protein
MPAGEWRAIYVHPNKDGKYTMPLIGFALIDDDGDGNRDIAGFDLEDGTINFVDEDESFEGYSYGGLKNEADPYA